MADRFPLILNTNSNQIQEIASGDNLDLTGSGIHNAGIITATTFSGPVVAGAGVSNITAGIGTYTDLRVGGDTTFSEDFVVTGNARVTGILTVGTSSIILNDSANTIKVGTALTLGHTQGLQFHTQNLHSAGFEVNQINVSGVATAATFKGDGDFVELDVDGHTNLDNVSITGVTTISGAAPNLLFTETDANPDWGILCSAGQMKFQDVTATANILTLDSNRIQAVKNLDALAGIDVTGNLIASGNLTANNGTITVSGTAPKITFTETNDNPDYKLEANGGNIAFVDTTNSATRLSISSSGINVTGNGTFSGNVSIGGTLTYEDVTNIDSVGIITARNGIDCTGTITATGEIRSQDDIRIQSSYPRFYLSDTDNNDDFSLINNNGNFLIYNDTANAFRIKIDGTHTHFATNQRPTADSTFDIGTNTLRWQNLFVDDVTVTGVVTATTFVGNLTGTASKVNLTSNNDNTLFRVPFTSANTGSVDLYSDTNSGMTYNPSTGLLYINGTMEAGTLQGALNASTGSFSGDVTFSGGAGAITLSAGSDIRMSSGTWTGEHAGKIQYHSNKMYFQGGSNGHQLRDNTGGTTFEINPSGTCAGVSLTLGQAVTHNADVTFSGGASAVSVAAASDIRIAGGTWTGEYTGGIKIQPDASNSYIQYHGNLYFRHSGGTNRFLLSQAGEAYIMSTADGVLNLNTTASNGAFMRFRKPNSSDTSLHVGVAKGMAAGSDTDDGAVAALRGNLILRANSGVISFTDGSAQSSGIDIVTRGGGTSGNDANSMTSPFIRFRDYPGSSYFNATTVDDNNWAIGADDSGVSEFKIVYGGGANSNRITSIQENSQTGTTVMGFQSDLQVTTTGFKITETAETSGTSSVGGSTRNAHYDATPGRGTYLVHGHITYRDSAPGGNDPDQVRLVLQVDGSDIAHASILDEDSNNTARNRTDTFTALITVNGSQNVQVESYTTDPADAGGADYRYRINIFKLGG